MTSDKGILAMGNNSTDVSGESFIAESYRLSTLSKISVSITSWTTGSKDIEGKVSIPFWG